MKYIIFICIIRKGTSTDVVQNKYHARAGGGFMVFSRKDVPVQQVLAKYHFWGSGSLHVV
jgi:hypothetical protein